MCNLARRSYLTEFQIEMKTASGFCGIDLYSTPQNLFTLRYSYERTGKYYIEKNLNCQKITKVEFTYLWDLDWSWIKLRAELEWGCVSCNCFLELFYDWVICRQTQRFWQGMKTRSLNCDNELIDCSAETSFPSASLRQHVMSSALRHSLNSYPLFSPLAVRLVSVIGAIKSNFFSQNLSLSSKL